jgi:putative ABC transport system permease protein
MGALLKLAFRNVFRYKRRTVITFSTVSLGLTLLIVGISLLDGFDQQAMTTIIDSQTSHLTVFQQGYFEKRDELPMNLAITGPDQIKARLQEIPGVKACESRILFAAGLIKGMDELPCLGVAIEPQADPAIFNIKQSLREGQWLEPGESKLLVGKDLARDIGLKVGDTVTLRVITSSGEEEFAWNALDLEVKGLFDSGNPLVDSQRVILPLEPAREALSLENRATEIVIRLTSGEQRHLLRVQNRVREMLSSQQENLEVVSWKELAGIFFDLSKSKKKRSAAIVFIMLFIAAMGIVNTMMMAVFERTAEIGMLAAMGMKESGIMRLFLLEGGIIGVCGSLLGCLLGGLGGWYLEVYGWSMGSMGTTFKKIVASMFPLKDVYYGDLSVGLLVIAFILGTAASVLAALYPAVKAAKLNPVDALRHV